MARDSTLTAGIDTGKHKLDIAVHGHGMRLTLENNSTGWRRLARDLADIGVGRVGIEATGGYERGVVAALRDHGMTVIVLQPVQVRAFAKLRLRRAKNDTLDAVLIAACTAERDDPPGTPDARLSMQADALTFVEQIEEDIARFSARLEHIHQARLRRLVAADIKRLRARRLAEMRRIVQFLRQHDDLARRLDLVQSVPGIGERTALALLLRLPELGQVSREEVAALAGLAPFDDDSGQHKGQRHIAGGRARLRRSLYAAALPAAFRWNPSLVAIYKRLTGRGKSHKLALVACARKLLIMANAVVARGAPWQAQEA